MLQQCNHKSAATYSLNHILIFLSIVTCRKVKDSFTLFGFLKNPVDIYYILCVF